MKKILTLTTALALTACAQHPGAVRAAKVTGTESCKNLPVLREELVELYHEQNEVRVADAFTMTFFMVPGASMAGASKKSQIAAVKGRIDALERKCL